MLYNLLSLKPSPSNSPSPEPTPSFRQETLTFLLSLGLSSDPSENPLKFSKKLDKKIFKNPIVLGTVKKKQYIARLCSVHQKIVRIGNFGASSRLSLALSQNSFAISLSYHGSSMVSKKTSRFLGHQDNKSYCACVCLSTFMLLCAMGHYGCLWKFMVCLRLSPLGHDS